MDVHPVVSLLSAAATGADDTPMTVAASTSSPMWRAEVDESARTIVAATTMIPLRKTTR
jgi:hypothetical protein